MNPYEWNYRGKSGVGAGLNSVMVLKWVEYIGMDDLEPEPQYVEGDDTDELD